MDEPARLVLGRRVRTARRRAGLTLAQLGERVGRPAPYLSQLENGRVEPRAGLVAGLADALGIPPGELLDPAPPDRRTALELELAELTALDRYRALQLPELPVRSLADPALEVLVAVTRAAVATPGRTTGTATDRARAANVALRDEMRARDNHFPEIEALAGDALQRAGYGGTGPVSERVLTDLAAGFGFTIERVQGMPRTARSITDRRRRIVYVPQRNDLRTRAARSVVLQTLGHFALGHARTDDFADYLRQRVESNYFAAAVLAPEQAAVRLLREAKEREDLSVEDLREVFYLSHEMAAHRFTNLATRHLGLPVHFLRTDQEGTILKAYENDGLVFPTDPDGAVEGARVGRHWGARQAWESSDSFDVHAQYTTVDGADYWCVTYLDTEGTPQALTVGTVAAEAHWFRGSETLRRLTGRVDPRGEADLIARWEGIAWASSAERSNALSALPPAERPFTPYPGIDLVDVYRFLDRMRRRR
jgi:predicted transcriptional regulator/transcriptional regulator with XRE-family HTH domain